MKRPVCAVLWLLLQACATTWLAPDLNRSVLQIPYSASVEMTAHVYRPEGPGPFPVVLFLHGRAPDKTDRQALRYPIPIGHAHYWLRKGFAVVAPLRPGYGATGGDDLEDSHLSPGGRFCSGHADFRQVVEITAAAVVPTLKWLVQEPWADTKRVIIVGQSVGGFAAIAACTKQLPGVVGCINFSGGAGGNSYLSPDHSCEPDELGAVFRELGAAPAPPSIWLYAVNDHYWGPTAPQSWFKEFERGGGHGVFVETAAVPIGEGHELMLHGAKLWSESVDRFLERLGFLNTPTHEATQPPSGR
jgi:dienelactone hydrolase